MKKLNSDSMMQQLPTIPCKPSIKRFQALGKHFAYDENSMALYEMSPSDAEISLDGIAAKEVPYLELGATPQEKHIVFQATYACNLKCRYCFVEHHYCDHKNTLTEQEHYDALKTFQPNGPFKLGWFGGEPLMNWETIFNVTEKVWEESKRRNLPMPQLHITSNGTLLTQEIANYAASKGFSWIISIDGPETLHDNNRPYRDGRGSYSDMMRGLTFLKKAYDGRPNPITLRGTFDAINTDVLGAVKHLNELMYQGYGAHVSVEPSTLGEGCSTKNRIERLSMAELRTLYLPQYEETARWFLSEIKAGRKPSLHHFEMPMQRIYDREAAFTECGAGVGYVSIGPGGKICACHREHRTQIGTMEEGIDPTKVARWRDNRLYNRNLCNTCWRRFICGGGCRCNSLLVNNKINDPSVVGCIFNDIQHRCAAWLLSEMTDKERKMYSKRQQMKMSPFLQPGKQPYLVVQNQNMAEAGISPSQVQPQQASIVPPHKLQACKDDKERVALVKTCRTHCQYDCQANCQYADQFGPGGVPLLSTNSCCGPDQKKDSCCGVDARKDSCGGDGCKCKEKQQ